MTAITSAVTGIISNIGAVVTSLFTGGSTPGALNPLLEYFAIGIGCSLLLFSILGIKKLVWGA